METHPVRPFVIYTAGRTGSSLLVELLANVHEIRCEPEILKEPVGDVRSFLERRIEGCGKPFYGFKLKLTHLREQKVGDPSAFLSGLSRDGWKIIHLVRDNVFLMVFSFLYAVERNKFFSYRFEYFRREEHVRIDPQQLLHLLDENTRFLREEEESLKGTDHLVIRYEKDLEERSAHRECLNRFCAYIGLPERRYPVKTNLKKSVPHPALRATNWNEIRDCLLQSPYAHFVPPEP